MQYTLKDILEFCYLHRGARGFKGYNARRMAGELLRAKNRNMLYITADDQGICGVLIVTLHNNWIYVHHIICVRTGFRTFIDYMRRKCSNMELYGKRGNKVINFSKLNK